MKRILNSYRGKASRYGSVLDRARRFRWRIRALYGLFGIALVLIGLRAVNLMVLPPEILEQRLQRQHQTVVELSPKRGIIFDRNGNVLSVSVDAPSVVADPKEVQGVDGKDDEASQALADQNVRAAAAALAPVLGLPELELREKLGRRSRFVWLARQVRDDTAAAVEALKLRGVLLRTEQRRAYPNRELAASVLGFVNIEGKGLEGLERHYDQMLSGSSHTYVRMRDGRNRDVTTDAVILRQSRGGGHLVLTLDLAIQNAAETALRKAILRTRAKGGFVLVMDPHSGEILANAQQPGFNPNVFSIYDPDVYRARAVTDVYEPGSTMKPFVIAGALQDGVTRPEELFDCEGGRWPVGKHIVHDTHEYDILSVRDIVKVSSNIGTAKIGERLGKDKLYAWLTRFGFGASTGSGFPGEVIGILRSPKKWSRIGLATHSFGQGLSVTGMQLAAALSAIANGGHLLQPWMIAEEVDEVGTVQRRGEPVELRRVLREDVSATLSDMMVGVTSIDGTAPLAAIPGYRVAGKTGTAQKVDPKTRRYGKGMYVSSFAGFVPADDPRLVVIAVLDEPQGRFYYGGLVAAPIFRDVATAALAYLGIPPTEPLQPYPVELKYLAQALGITLPEIPTADDAEAEADAPRLAPAVEDPALVPATPAPAAAPDAAAEAAVAQGAEGGPDAVGWVVPDLTGQPMREVLRVVQGLDLEVVMSGSGRVAAQVPPAGKTLAPGEALKVVFSPDPTQLASSEGARR